MTQYKHIKINSLINKIISKDKLFTGDYTIDPYQNCEIGCIYCDSSYEKTVYIKTNAVEILKEELKQYKKGTIILGSVHDPYQNVEKKYRLTREILKTIKEYNFRCHILTKSNLVLRDIDLLMQSKQPIVTISLTSINNKISKVFECNAPAPMERLRTVEKLNENGIKSGVAVIPWLPYFIEEEIEDFIKNIKKHKACYILHKHLELKGDQKNIFFNYIKKHYPSILEKYDNLYKNSYTPQKEYVYKIDNKISNLCKVNKIMEKIRY